MLGTDLGFSGGAASTFNHRHLSSPSSLMFLFPLLYLEKILLWLKTYFQTGFGGTCLAVPTFERLNQKDGSKLEANRGYAMNWSQVGLHSKILSQQKQRKYFQLASHGTVSPLSPIIATQSFKVDFELLVKDMQSSGFYKREIYTIWPVFNSTMILPCEWLRESNTS